MPASADFGLKKSWYLSRGKSNMEIGNYKAAIEAYEKVIEEDSENLEAMRALGIAYESQGFKDKAIAQYDRYLEKNPKDAEIAYRQAEALEWSRYAYRKEDAKKYYRMGLMEKPDNKYRLRYARLLASNRETNGEAIAQYEAVLRSQPRSGDAHRGLAKAYAWNGQNDKAVHHSALAKKYGSSMTDLKSLDSDLRKGREPSVGGEFLFLTQPGTGYDLNGFQLSTLGKTEIGAFVTARAQAGYESYWHAGNESSAGAFVRLGAQGRFDEQQAVDVTLGYHALSPEGRSAAEGGTGNVTLKAEYQYRDVWGYRFAPGFERALRRDSYLSLASAAARTNFFYTDFSWDKEVLEYGIKPYLGWVSTASLSSNIAFGADAVIQAHLNKDGAVGLTVGDLIQVSHYGEDQSALSGSAAGGYFSPQLYLNQYPHLTARLNLSDTQGAELTGGPTFQFVKDQSLNGAWQVGANVSAGYSSQFKKRLHWKVSAGYAKVANKFNQVQVDNSLTYVF